MISIGLPIKNGGSHWFSSSQTVSEAELPEGKSLWQSTRAQKSQVSQDFFPQLGCGVRPWPVVAKWRLGPNGMVFSRWNKSSNMWGSAGLKRKKNGFSIVWPWEIRFWHIWFSTLNWTLSFIYEYIWYPPLAVIIWARKSRRVTIVNQESRFRLGGIFGT